MSDVKSVKTAKLKDRRDFLKNAAVAGGVSAIAVASSGSQAATVEQEESEVKTEKGYRLTQHIRDYYDSARS